MSPTLLELIVAILLLVIAWQIGVSIAPRLIASFIAFWRAGKPPVTYGPHGPEKNITPPATPGDKSRQNYASSPPK